jgi:8-oxo-dGTP diphosphatase
LIFKGYNYGYSHRSRRRSGQTRMKRIPCASIILENLQGEVLLLLRDNKSTTIFPNHWTLIGGSVEEEENPEMAARRELAEGTGMKADLTFWKRYDRGHTLFIVDQHIYLAKVNISAKNLLLGEGQGLEFFKPAEIGRLKIGYGFKTLLNEYFSMTIGNLHVHYP